PETMVAIAAAASENKPWTELLPRHFSARRQQAVRQSVESGLKAEKPPGFVRGKGHRQSEAEKRRLRSFEDRRDERAANLGIDPTLIANRATLVLLAKDWKLYQSE